MQHELRVLENPPVVFRRKGELTQPLLWKTMTILRTAETFGTFTRTSNYAGNTQFPVKQTYEIDEGSGVVKRPNWRSLPYPDISSPLSYAKSWKKEYMGVRTYRHTETGPGGSPHLYLNEIGPLSNGTTFAYNGEIPGCLSEAEYKSKVKLFNSLKGEGANLANMLGERQQVANSVKNAIQTLYYGARDLRRGNIASAVRRFGGDPKTARKLQGTDIANQWLSLQYGWKPLLSDSYDIVNSLHKREMNRLVTFRASSRHSMKRPSDSSWAFDPWGKNHGVRQTTAINKYMIRAWPNSSFAEPAALGFTNPLTVLWEVTPWSFVVDWFLPIGRYLEQFSAAHGWDFHDGCVSTLVKSNEQASYSVKGGYTSSGWTYTTEQSLKNANNSYVRFQRTPLAGFPTPSMPRFKSPISLAHFWNSLALLSQQVLGRKK